MDVVASGRGRCPGSAAEEVTQLDLRSRAQMEAWENMEGGLPTENMQTSRANITLRAHARAAGASLAYLQGSR